MEWSGVAICSVSTGTRRLKIHVMLVKLRRLPWAAAIRVMSQSSDRFRVIVDKGSLSLMLQDVVLSATQPFKSRLQREQDKMKYA